MPYANFAGYYDRLMENMPYEKWLVFIEECWRRYGKPDTLADLGCGTGNLAIPLAQTGIKVTGIDLSADMLAVAQNKSRSLLNTTGSENPSWLQQDICEWELHGQVDAAVSFCDCFNYIVEEDDIQRAFRHTYQGLRAGGLFVFDVHTPQLLVTYAHTQPFVWNEQDLAYIWTCELESERCEIVHELTMFVRESSQTKFSRIEEIHVQRAYKLDWLQKQLTNIGFSEVACYGDFSWEPVHSHTERAFFICKK